MTVYRFEDVVEKDGSYTFKVMIGNDVIKGTVTAETYNDGELLSLWIIEQTAQTKERPEKAKTLRIESHTELVPDIYGGESVEVNVLDSWDQIAGPPAD